MNLFRIASATLAALAFVLTVGAVEPEPTLIWDAELKEHETKPGETEAQFSFTAKNGSTTEIVINEVRPSCGCTLVSMPPKPWKLAPGASGTIEAKLDLRGKSGTLIKHLSVNSSVGVKSLVFKVTIPDLTPANPSISDRGTNLRRVVNRLTAGGDRQAVFKNDCATCHVEPSIGKMGPALFITACGICHTAAHRASMVPELTGLPNGGDRDYWHTWISHGKEGTLMPAFSKPAGGPLTDEQIKSLVDYMLSLETLTGVPPSEPSSQSKTPEQVESVSSGNLEGQAEGSARAPAKDDLALYRKTATQPGHELVKTDQFIVPVGTAVAIDGLEFSPGARKLSARQEMIVRQVFDSLEEITENTLGDTNPARVAEFSKLEFEIRAYADGAGGDQQDLVLSQERADVVYQLLTYLGTPPWRLKAIGAGAGSPPDSKTVEARSDRNNRVEFVRLR